MAHSTTRSVITIDLHAAAIRWSALVLIAFAATAGAWFAERWYVGSVVAEYAPGADQGGIDMANIAARWAPADPYAHWRLAALQEENFSADNLQQAVREYELAVSLSPHDYRYWMELGREFDASGDADAAEKALGRAVELAPAYSYPRWYFGNVLLREGKLAEAFAQLRPAARNDEVMRPQIFSLAWQAFDKDADAIAKFVCPSSLEQMQFAEYLVSANAFDDALRMWAIVPASDRKADRTLADRLQDTLIEKRQFRKALEVMRDIAAPGVRLPQAEQFWNGGFEDAALTPGLKPFGWTIESRPQVRVEVDKRSHSGQHSLRFDFRVSGKSDTNQASQTIATAQNTTYRLECYFSTQGLNSAGMPVITIADTADNSILATSQPLPTGTNDWQRLIVDFKTKPGSEGIIVNFSRAACDALQTQCPIFGSVWYDDFSLQRLEGRS